MMVWFLMELKGHDEFFKLKLKLKKNCVVSHVSKMPFYGLTYTSFLIIIIRL